MHQTLAILTSLAALVGAAGAMGCGSSSSADGGSPTTTCNSSPSFVTDVMPVFQRNCTLSGVCHGQMGNSGEENLYLGMNVPMGSASADAMAVYKGLVGVAAVEDPSMNLVKASDLQNSFLWHKVNDSIQTLSAGTLATGCMKTTMMCSDCSSTQACGGTMPYNSEPLMTSRPMDLCTLQNWITAGAQNN